jgi:hypothetical protein
LNELGDIGIDFFFSRRRFRADFDGFLLVGLGFSASAPAAFS